MLTDVNEQGFTPEPNKEIAYLCVQLGLKGFSITKITGGDETHEFNDLDVLSSLLSRLKTITLHLTDSESKSCTMELQADQEPGDMVLDFSDDERLMSISDATYDFFKSGEEQPTEEQLALYQEQRKKAGEITHRFLVAIAETKLPVQCVFEALGIAIGNVSYSINLPVLQIGSQVLPLAQEYLDYIIKEEGEQND